MLNLRPELPGDQAAIFAVNQAAFGQPVEGELVDALRQAGALSLSLVAEQDGQIVAHVAFSPTKVESPSGDYAALGLAPVAVLPPWQNQGIGGRLIREALLHLAARGVEGLVVLGHPDYYPRFGFVTASSLGLRWEGKYPDEAFMALEFRPGFFAARGGLVRYHPAFDRFVE